MTAFASSPVVAVPPRSGVRVVPSANWLTWVIVPSPLSRAHWRKRVALSSVGGAL